MFHELYKKMDLSKTKTVAVNAGYKMPGVVREIFLEENQSKKSVSDYSETNFGYKLI